MLERKYDPTLPYRYACYGRMSDPRQNKRSPDQQFNTIEETRQRCGYPWQRVVTYRDDGISGRKVRKRPGLQKMLRDIEVGLVRIDLIVVDTYERLGRAEEIGSLRHKLLTDHGILVVAADNGFADPTGIVGKAVGLVEQIRATENTRVSRHNVIRGKKDVVRLRRWPGGPRPFGYRLKPVVDDSTSPPDVYHVLEPEPKEAAAQVRAFLRAAETGEGDMRLSQWWNNSPEIPAEFRPMSPFTMGYRLSNPIYVGTLVWGENRTGVVNDTRVVEPNPDGAEVVPDFCPPLVSAELFQQVQKLREVRARQIRRSRRKEAAESPPKLIAPQGRGLTLKYLLTGLLRCAGCNASLRPVPTGRRSKGGKRYVYYACPRHYDGACANSRHLPEDQLRDAVLARLRARLFPPQGPAGQTPPWLPELVRLVGQELGRYREQEPIRAAAGRKELQEIERQVAGWGMTLGDPSLPEGVRKDITAMYERAIVRKQGLEQAAAGERALQDHLEHMLDPKVVIGQLQKLGAVLAGFNPTLGNLELSKHIDRIVCHPDGKIEMRGTLLGLFEGAVELLSRTESEAPPVAAPAEPERYGSVVPRRRARLRVPDLAAESAAAAGNGDTALDPERFTSLPEPFLWSEVFVLDRKLCWAQEHSVEVARLRATGLTMERLAAHFGMSTPTIRKALQLAPAADESVRQLPRKVSRRCWAEEHAAEVAGLRAEGLGVEEIARRLGKSDTTIRAALRHARHRTTPAQDKAVGQGRSDVAPHDPVPARNIKRKENP